MEQVHVVPKMTLFEGAHDVRVKTQYIIDADMSLLETQPSRAVIRTRPRHVHTIRTDITIYTPT